MEKRGQIEFIVACATIIYELLKNKTPTTTTTNLLSTAIFANTLNFKSITPIQAYKVFLE